MFLVAYIPLVLLWSRYCFAEDKACIPRDFNEGSIVCVCNSTYCDSIESVNKLTPERYWVITSAKDGRRFQKQQSLFSDKKFENGGEDLTLTIDNEKKFQTIFGFGGAFTDAATINIMNLSKGARNNLMQSYFSSKGIEYTFGRVPIGGCDFSPRPYTYDDDHDGDFNLTYFNLTTEDLNYKIPIIQQALAMSNRTIKMFASPWSAPAWMKTNNALKGAGELKGVVGGKYYQTWADYYIKFLEAYQLHNISFWGLTAQNEPLDGWIPYFQFNCMGFKAESQRIFIGQNLGPTLAKKGFGNIKLMILDDQRLMLPGWAKEVLRNENNKAKDYVDGIAFHWYLNFIIPASLLTKTHDLFPDKFLLATESCEGSQPGQRHVIMGDWLRGESYAEDIIEDLSQWTTGWVDWNICLNEDGGPNWIGGAVDSPIIINGIKDEFYKQPMYYTLGHFSKFVVPDSVLVEVSSSNNLFNFQYIAFKRPDDSTTITLLNRKETQVNVIINDSNKGSFQVTSPARSIQTYIWWN